jgi:hypothetical protein
MESLFIVSKCIHIQYISYNTNIQMTKYEINGTIQLYIRNNQINDDSYFQ